MAQALVGTEGPLAGWRFELADGRVVLGREPGCGLRLGEPRVSGRHAALTVEGRRTWLEDLGSAEGTFVNGHPIHGRYELRQGDVVDFAVVRMRFDGPAPPPRSVQFAVGSQPAGVVNNVGGNQYYLRQRDSMLREIAATRTRGSRLIWFGLVVTVVGFGMFAAGVLGFMSDIARNIGSRSFEPPGTPFGPVVLGMPSGLLGWAIAAIGMVLVVLGIIQHVVATARRRRVDREMPFPPQY